MRVSRQEKLKAYFAIGAVYFPMWCEIGIECEQAYVNADEQALKRLHEELVAQLLVLVKSSVVHYWDITEMFREAMGDFGDSDFVGKVCFDLGRTFRPNVTDEEIARYEEELLYPDRYDFSHLREELKRKSEEEAL